MKLKEKYKDYEEESKKQRRKETPPTERRDKTKNK